VEVFGQHCGKRNKVSDFEMSPPLLPCYFDLRQGVRRQLFQPKVIEGSEFSRPFREG
jgi:hypothetical protein